MAYSNKLEEIGELRSCKMFLCASHIFYTVFLLELSKTFLPIVEQFLSSLNVFHAVVFYFFLDFA